MASTDDHTKADSGSLREIKALMLDLKQSLNAPSAKPGDREVEFQRQNLRRHYISAMFKFPEDPVVDRLETSLWIETSHAFIDKYRRLLVDMKARIARSSAANSKQPKGGKVPRHKAGEDGPVALRKLQGQFRTFLAAEEKFWTDLAIRYAQTFGLEETGNTIRALHLTATDPEDLVQGTKSPIISPSNADTRFTAPSQTLRGRKLLFFQKCLISLGDLARYREQNSDNNTGPTAQNDRGRRNGRRDNNPPLATNLPGVQQQNHSKSFEFYQQARLLLPNEGNPSNQLAILSLRAGDLFGATMHYYRALCVQQAFPTSRDNLLKPLHKAMTDYDKQPIEGGDMERLKLFVLVLHGYWHHKPEDPKSLIVADSVIANFFTLISERSLPPDIILNIMTMAVAALWSIRSYTSQPGKTIIYTPEHQIVAENTILAHSLGLLRILMARGVAEMDEATATSFNDDTSDGLARFITATFRRTLPALRISSRWFRLNVGAILKHFAESSDEPGCDVLKQSLSAFWATFVAFGTHLTRVFPLDKLPSPPMTLDEDIELQGFIPFQGPSDSEGGGPLRVSDSSKMHPNDEHLIRLRDIQVDALYVANLETSPITYFRGVYSLQTATPIDIPRQTFKADAISETGESDEVRTVSTEDLIGLAMEATLDEQVIDDDDDEDDEQVVYPQTSTPKVVPIQMLTGISPSAFPPPLSSAASPSRITAGGTTAEDLLSRVLGRSSTPLGLTRLRTNSDATSTPFLNSPLGGSPQHQQRLSPRAVQDTPSYTFNQPIGPPSYPKSTNIGYPNSTGLWDRAVGAPANQQQHHHRSESYSNQLQQQQPLQQWSGTPSPYARPQQTLQQQLQSLSISARPPASHLMSDSISTTYSNPLGAIGRSAPSTNANVYDPRFSYSPVAETYPYNSRHGGSKSSIGQAQMKQNANGIGNGSFNHLLPPMQLDQSRTSPSVNGQYYGEMDIPDRRPWS